MSEAQSGDFYSPNADPEFQEKVDQSTTHPDKIVTKGIHNLGVQLNHGRGVDPNDSEN